MSNDSANWSHHIKKKNKIKSWWFVSPIDYEKNNEKKQIKKHIEFTVSRFDDMQDECPLSLKERSIIKTKTLSNQISL